MKYLTIAVRLRLSSPSVVNLLQRIGFDDPTLTPIALTHKIYTEEDFIKIRHFYHRRFTEVEIPEGSNPKTVRREYLTENLKLPRGLKYTDIAGFLSDKVPFRALRNEDRIIAGVSLERFLIKGHNNYNVVNNLPKTHYKVYAFALKSEINTSAKYINANPDWNQTKPAFYIGQTSKSRLERFEQHTTGIKANAFVKNFGVRPFELANKTDELAELCGVPVEGLRHYQAQYYEFKLTRLLKEKGFGAYCK
jgi:uncharacterized protein (DUF2132 family)